MFLNLIKKLNELLNDFYCLSDERRNKGIEGLRAIAVLMVFNTHVLSNLYFNNFYVENNQFLLSVFKFLQSGHYGVDIFFVISGYLICKTLKKNPSFKRYMRRRFLRLMPAHLAVLAILIPSGFLWINLVENAMFLTSFFRNLPAYNYVTWSLGWEWLFYLIFFPISKLMRDGSRLKFYGSILGFFLLLVLLTSPEFLNVNLHNFGIEIPLPGRFFGFFIGVLIALELPTKIFMNFKKTVPIITNLGLIGLIFWTFIYAENRELPNFYSYINMNFYFVVLDCFCGMILFGLITLDSVSLTKKIMECKILRVLGQVSYSFYLVHASIGIPLASKYLQVKSISEIPFYYALSFLITFLIATISFVLFERPLIKR